MSPKLLDDVRVALRIRHRLAHDFLLLYQLEVTIDPDAADGAAASFLEATSAFINDVGQRLDEVVGKRLVVARGVQPSLLADEDIEAIMDDLREWLARDTPDNRPE